MSSNEVLDISSGIGRVSVDKEIKMREYRRPTLCVIDENGIEITQDSDHEEKTGSNASVLPNNVKFSLSDFVSRDFNSNLTKVNNSDLLAPDEEKDLDLNELKATTARLKLSTRRQSTVAWQNQHLSESRNPVIPKLDTKGKSEQIEDDFFTEERKNRINESLAWLRNELQQMRQEDEVLARKLLSIRADIHRLKLQRSCEEHKEMLEDVTMEMEEDHELLGISDLPLTDSVHDSPLRHLGVMRMHLSARRFSTC
ncbi:hypothetical protein ACF0H5_005716 [Mactra antiquata]